MAIDKETIESGEQEAEFGRGYFLLLGLLAGMFVTFVVVVVTVLIVTAPLPEVAPEPTVPVAVGEPDVANGDELFSRLAPLVTARAVLESMVMDRL